MNRASWEATMESVQERAAWVAEGVEVWKARARLAALDWAAVGPVRFGDVDVEERSAESDGAAGRPEFDVAGHVLRARRRGDLSQRELAILLGVSQSTVNRYEQPGADLAVGRFAQVLAEAGLRLAVLDETGTEIEPVSAREVRDNGGRRFPAHLDVFPPDQVPSHRISRPRYDRMPTKAWCHHRSTRDCYRAVRADEIDHPTVDELARRRWVLTCRRLEARVIRTAERRLRVAAASVWTSGTSAAILRHREHLARASASSQRAHPDVR
ncbi:helix-turn-helix transcriptional regulator [Occultella gossypii]|uniref:Helix-turn-helix transcriptional regulator n=1 Tax=Occultella gossypii TaxID=2800820 RepID=A0ABS7S810_9MICO|nr:helix-turn-helix transcriptional regulator [Occultella gossypii]MBZ2196484.1 helix-turn-helix transcriptional regulator [Occultella gossypii]